MTRFLPLAFLLASASAVHAAEGVTLAVHLCRRNWGRRGWGAARGYEAILEHVKRLDVDQPEQIVERVNKALEHIAAERFTLSPDCGFSPGKNHGIPLDESFKKLKSLSAAAGLLRERA